jgi:hypothetical protein
MKLILNLLTVPIKVLLVAPISVLEIIIMLSGYNEAIDFSKILTKKWF